MLSKIDDRTYEDAATDSNGSKVWSKHPVSFSITLSEIERIDSTDVCDNTPTVFSYDGAIKAVELSHVSRLRTYLKSRAKFPNGKKLAQIGSKTTYTEIECSIFHELPHQIKNRNASIAGGGAATAPRLSIYFPKDHFETIARLRLNPLVEIFINLSIDCFDRSEVTKAEKTFYLESKGLTDAWVSGFWVSDKRNQISTALISDFRMRLLEDLETCLVEYRESNFGEKYKYENVGLWRHKSLYDIKPKQEFSTNWSDEWFRSLLERYLLQPEVATSFLDWVFLDVALCFFALNSQCRYNFCKRQYRSYGRHGWWIFAFCLLLISIIGGDHHFVTDTLKIISIIALGYAGLSFWELSFLRRRRDEGEQIYDLTSRPLISMTQLKNRIDEMMRKRKSRGAALLPALVDYLLSKYPKYMLVDFAQDDT